MFKVSFSINRFVNHSFSRRKCIGFCNFSPCSLRMRNTSTRDLINGVALIWSTLVSRRNDSRPSTRELRTRLTAPRVILLENNIYGFNCTGSDNLSLAPGSQESAQCTVVVRATNSRPLDTSAYIPFDA